MENVQTITLEILRHGPAHNQLLSPLTRYMALCGNHPTATVTVPFEHQQFLTRLRALRYQESRETRELQLRDTAQQMAGIFGAVPGLIAELCERPEEKAALTHLELVLSSSELALLPFEAADAPDGFPGAGQSLVLQSQLPVCITRRVRRVANLRFQWPSQPRILFAAAAPPGAGSIPLESHLLALRRAVEPWMRFYAEDDEQGRQRAVEQRLVFLPRASVKSLEETCRKHLITHVHFLAHGKEFEQAGNQRFGLALHDGHDPSRTDVVDGTRLATALRTCSDQTRGGLAMPAVVSIAACDSGGVGSVVGAGASVAHAVHEAGVPLVVASQFPLSFAGSVIMVEGLYERLLWGADPRRALNCLRREMRSRIADTHDWASLVAYAAFPPDLEVQVARERRERVADSIGVALDRADGFLKYQDPADGEGKSLQEALDCLERGLERLKNLSEGKIGLLASTEKRKAQVLYQASKRALSEDDRKRWSQASRKALEDARKHYREVYQRDPVASWAMVQYLALSEVLGDPSADRFQLWTMAKGLAEVDLRHGQGRVPAWAHSSLAELCMLSTLLDPGATGVPSTAEACEQARHHARELLRVTEDFVVDLYVAQRQFRRYESWFQELLSPDAMERIRPVLQAVLEELPDDPVPIWE